jgi:uncharacterized protein (UPF0305 family)
MKASTLLKAIQIDLEPLSTHASDTMRKPQEIGTGSISTIMARYNHDNLLEILGRDSVSPDFEIGDGRLRDFRQRIGHYLDTYAPGDLDFKMYITGISLYLAFIAKRPLHPPGLESGNGPRIVKKGNSYYCSGKRQFINDDQSLCKYCVCKQLL